MDIVNWALWKLWSTAPAKSLQSCPTLCDPIDGSPPGTPVPGILQARTLEWVAISFSNAGKWKWSRSVVPDPQRPHGLQPTRLLRPWDFPGKSTGVRCHCLLRLFPTTMQLIQNQPYMSTCRKLLSKVNWKSLWITLNKQFLDLLYSSNLLACKIIQTSSMQE